METWEADDARRRHMARFGRRDTAPELALRRELHRRGRRFFVERRVSSRCRHFCEEHAHLTKANADHWHRKLLANLERDAQNRAILVSGR